MGFVLALIALAFGMWWGLAGGLIAFFGLSVALLVDAATFLIIAIWLGWSAWQASTRPCAGSPPGGCPAGWPSPSS